MDNYHSKRADALEVRSGDISTMTAPTRQNGYEVARVERACIRKLRYPDEMTARAAGMHYIDRGEATKLFWYPCPHCAGFHLTSNDNGHKRNVRVFS